MNYEFFLKDIVPAVPSYGLSDAPCCCATAGHSIHNRATVAFRINLGKSIVLDSIWVHPHCMRDSLGAELSPADACPWIEEANDGRFDRGHFWWRGRCDQNSIWWNCGQQGSRRVQTRSQCSARKMGLSGATGHQKSTEVLGLVLQVRICLICLNVVYDM